MKSPSLRIIKVDFNRWVIGYRVDGFGQGQFLCIFLEANINICLLFVCFENSNRWSGIPNGGCIKKCSAYIANILYGPGSVFDAELLVYLFSRNDSSEWLGPPN
jgi:hypothetical protein